MRTAVFMICMLAFLMSAGCGTARSCPAKFEVQFARESIDRLIDEGKLRKRRHSSAAWIFGNATSHIGSAASLHLFHVEDPYRNENHPLSWGENRFSINCRPGIYDLVVAVFHGDLYARLDFGRVGIDIGGVAYRIEINGEAEIAERLNQY